MKSAYEILRSKSPFSTEIRENESEYVVSFEDAIEAMKEYAKQIAVQVLQEAAANAKVIFIDGKTKEQTSHLMIYSGAHCMMPDTDLILKTKIELP